MYSLEPPLYFMLNKAIRSKNMAYLEMLGPFAKAISTVLRSAEQSRNDHIKRGHEMHRPREGLQDPLGYMSGSMVVFRGALFPTKYILEFHNMIGKR